MQPVVPVCWGTLPRGAAPLGLPTRAAGGQQQAPRGLYQAHTAFRRGQGSVREGCMARAPKPGSEPQAHVPRAPGPWPPSLWAPANPTVERPRRQGLCHQSSEELGEKNTPTQSQETSKLVSRGLVKPALWLTAKFLYRILCPQFLLGCPVC